MIFDTETTGLPKNNLHDWSDCRLIQLGYLIINNKYEILSSKSFIINDSSYKSGERAQMIHKITERRRINEGVDFDEVYHQWTEDLRKCSGLICHGCYFDIPVMLHECKVRKYNTNWIDSLTLYDTKKSSLYDHQHSLQETVNLIYPEQQDSINNCHDALYDSRLCLLLFRATKNKRQMIRDNEHIKSLIMD